MIYDKIQKLITIVEIGITSQDFYKSTMVEKL